MGLTSKKKLTNQVTPRVDGNRKLANLKSLEFKLAISEQLENKYCFKDLRPSDIKIFHNFLDETVGKKLTITEVDSLFLRTKGGPKQEINGRDVVHYGKGRQSFRIFGYYNQDGYFTITRIDPRHKINK